MAMPSRNDGRISNFHNHSEAKAICPLPLVWSDKPTDSLPFLSLVSSEQFDIEKGPGRIKAAIGIMALVSFLDDTEETEI